ncbi:MAG TPA: ATP-binding protein [Vicinamibacteria bacterium]|nr:ATP-binding protein [Vicinamibacteria bacterium]
MRRLRDLSIRQKLTRVAMLSSSLALIFAATAFIAYDVLASRSAVARRLSTEAEIIASNIASALLFQDPAAARTTLAGLGAESHVRAAAVYNAQGHLFAHYAPDSSTAPPAPLARPLGDEVHGRTVVVSRPILFEDDKMVGTVVLQGDLEDMGTRLLRYASLVALVSAISFLLALALSSRMQSVISRPIVRLAEGARRVSREKDYTVRVAPEGRDEVGELIETFNEMLSGIQERDANLKEASRSLEQRVEDRTRDLQRELQERRRAEQELKRSQMLLAEAQRLAHVGSWEWDSSRNAVALSDEIYRVFGRKPSGGTEGYAAFMDAIHPTDRPRVREGLRAAVKARSEWSGELRIIPPEGELRWVYGYAKVLPGDADGSIRVVGTVQDITGRKAGEEERAQLIHEQAARAEAESARRRAAFLAEVGASLAASLDDRATLANIARLAVPEVADWSVVHIVNNDVPEPVAAQHADPTRLADLWEMARRLPDRENTGGVYDVIRTGEARLYPALPSFTQLADPELVGLVERVGYTSMMLVPLCARNNTFGCLTLGAVGRRFTDADLTLAQSLAERGALAADNARLYREAQEANRIKDEFLATLSHELRTPLNAIVGWTKLLQDGRLDAATQARAIATIDRNARAQTQLIEDILDVSRIVAGKLSLDVRAVDLSAVIEGALDSVRHAAEAKGVRLVTEIARAVGPFEGDGDRLQQVAWNLVSNAIKFSTRGGTVQVRLRQSGDQAEISVQDDGLGIKPEFLPHVFERFRQADSSSTRPHGGLGLGLAIVRHLVELHGGSVEVSSPGEGKGSTFTVRLPLREEAGPPEIPRRMPAAAATPQLSGVDVLVVEDESDARELIRTMLEQLGAGVVTASSAQEGLAALDARSLDVLLSDIEMPGMDGYSFMRAVRERPASRGGQIPAAALTAYARPEDRDAALRAGYQLHVSKPVQPAELAAVVSSLAGRSLSK